MHDLVSLKPLVLWTPYSKPYFWATFLYPKTQTIFIQNSQIPSLRSSISSGSTFHCLGHHFLFFEELWFTSHSISMMFSGMRHHIYIGNYRLEFYDVLVFSTKFILIPQSIYPLFKVYFSPSHIIIHHCFHSTKVQMFISIQPPSLRFKIHINATPLMKVQNSLLNLTLEGSKFVYSTKIHFHFAKVHTLFHKVQVLYNKVHLDFMKVWFIFEENVIFNFNENILFFTF